MPPHSTVDDCFARLHAAGWSIGDVRIITDEGSRWLVSGTNGENRITARGLTQTEAWDQACRQAETLGMLKRQRDQGRPRRDAW